MSNDSRGKAPNAHSKQRICTPTENALLKLTQHFQGLSRLGQVLYLQGPYISLEQLERAVVRLQRRHPVLRCRFQAHPTKRDCFVFEEDETLRLHIEELARKRDERFDFWIQEWSKREREPIHVGDALAKVWLLQDPADKEDTNGFREVVFMCEHAISDGISVSNAAHELLQILSDETGHACNEALPWGRTMEEAVRNTLSGMKRVTSLSRFVCSTIYKQLTNRLPVARVPLSEVDFNINEMDKYCHSEATYGFLNKEMTTKLLARCHREGVTVTAAVTSAILSVTAGLVAANDGHDALISIALSADTRRRCIPAVPNYDLAYHASGIAPFGLSLSSIPKMSENLWPLAQNYGRHINTCVNANQILASGMLTAKVYEMLRGPIKMAYTPTYGTSSWGVLPFVEQYGSWKLTAATPFMNIVRWAMPFTIIQTVNGVLTLMFGGACPLVPASLLTTLRDQCMDTLQRMIDSD